MVNLILKATYQKTDGTDKIVLSRTIRENDNLEAAVGEVIYAVETQAKTFTTHDIFEKIQMPDVITITKTLVDEQNDVFVLKLTVTKRK